jgi:hypothetical protein
VAEILKRRLADLRAAASIEDLVAGQPRELDGSHGQHMVVDLRDGCRVIFCANHPKNPTTENGDLDWAKVSRVRILRIERDHG